MSYPEEKVKDSKRMCERMSRIRGHIITTSCQHAFGRLAVVIEFAFLFGRTMVVGHPQYLPRKFATFDIRCIDSRDKLGPFFSIRAAAVNRFDPAVIQCRLNCNSFGRIRVKHAQKETLKGELRESAEYFSARRKLAIGNESIWFPFHKLFPTGDKLGIVGIFRLGSLPRCTAETKRKTDNCA